MATPRPQRPFKVVTEAARERETFRYATSQITGSLYLTDPSSVPTTLRASHDSVVTALIELAALRLNAARATVSVFDRQWHYTIAEATPALPITPSAVSSGTDARDDGRLLLCGTAIPRSFAICEHVLTDQQGEDGQAGSGSLPIYVIPDLSLYAPFLSNPYFREWPYRFYAAAPIRSARGVNIGVLNVFGHEARHALDPTSAELLQDLAQAIMTHLEATRSNDAHRRANRMVRGVGTFVEGEASLSGWQDDANVESFADNVTLEGSLNAVQQDLQQHLDRVDQTARGIGHDGITMTGNDPRKPTPMHANFHENASATNEHFTRSPGSPPPSLDEDPEKAVTRHIFSKAANIVRESIEVEGVLFLDASIASFGGEVGRSGHNSRSSSSSGDNGLEERFPTGNSDIFSRILGFSDSSRSSINNDSGSRGQRTVSETFLAKLLRRYPNGKIFNFDENGSLQSSDTSGDDRVPGPPVNSSKSAVINRLPDTKPTASPKLRPGPNRTFSRQNDAKNIIHLFPGARSVVFTPIWDSQRQRWLAGGFFYTMTATRSFTMEGEASYLAAFATLIMAEIHRSRDILVSKAKTDLLSSLSHELRSPLHGIVLGAELLRDTSLDLFQCDVLNSIENCGRTLMDTVDHMLDWTKINRFKSHSGERRNDTRRSRGEKVGTNKSVEAGMMSIVSDVDIDIVAEQVVESMFAGHSFQTLSLARLADERQSGDADLDALSKLDSIQALEDSATPSSSKLGDVRVVLGGIIISLDISSGLRWTFNTQPGAIRRVIMNLLGNALKFTTQGSVKVLLEQEPAYAYGSSTRVVKLTVTDTGRGISQDYLNHHVFKPFSQENSLAPGTGLGLSLVRNIVSALGGSIDIQSQVGQGTSVTVKLPMKLCLPKLPEPSTTSVDNTEDQGDFQDQVGELKGLRVLINGFTTKPGDAADATTERAMVDEHALLARVCREWLKMHVIEPEEEGLLLPDLVLRGDKHLDLLPSELRNASATPTVVICRSALIARQLTASLKSASYRGSEVVQFVAQPIGPRKLANILVLCLKRWTNLQAGSITSDVLSTTSEEDSTPEVTSPLIDHDAKEYDALLQDQPVQSTKNTLTRSWPPHTTESAQPSVSQTEPPPTPASRPEEDGPPSKRRSTARYLLVDDNMVNLKILAAYMKKIGRSHDTAVNGLEAFELFKKGRGQYRYIFMDISMPVMDGFEATRRIRAFEREQELPRSRVYALTGLASANAQQEAHAVGIDLFLTKPVKLKELTEILESRKPNAPS